MRDQDAITETHELYQRDKEDRMQWVNQQQSHYEYLKDNIYV